MAFKLNKNDRDLLALIAEYRLLSTSQIAFLIQRSSRSGRRRLQALAEAHLIELFSRGFGAGRGRPECLVSLAWRGIDLLRKDGILSGDKVDDRAKAIGARYMDHQLLVNWFRIHLIEIERVVPQLLVRFLAPTSPFLERERRDLPLISDQVTMGDSSAPANTFVPDGVFAITDNKRGKTSLFFLEVDIGTESVGSMRGNSGAIRQKILTYQAYFQTGAYRRYDEFWPNKPTGFRVLFVTISLARLSAMCALAQAMPPSDFVWLTEAARMFEHGVSAAIWARGGRLDAPLESILGSLACRAPISGIKP